MGTYGDYREGWRSTASQEPPRGPDLSLVGDIRAQGLRARELGQKLADALIPGRIGETRIGCIAEMETPSGRAILGAYGFMAFVAPGADGTPTLHVLQAGSSACQGTLWAEYVEPAQQAGMPIERAWDRKHIVSAQTMGVYWLASMGVLAAAEDMLEGRTRPEAGLVADGRRKPDDATRGQIILPYDYEAHHAPAPGR